MKSIKMLAVAIMAVITFSSCTKTGGVEVGIQIPTITLGFQIAGVPITLSLGGSGQYYDQSAYSGFVYGQNWQSMSSVYTACYVMSKPGNSESVAVYDKYGNQIGMVRCDQGAGSQTNAIYIGLINWFNTHNSPCIVNVAWTPRPFTNGPWTGTIVG